jgi:hypothetical protein
MNQVWVLTPPISWWSAHLQMDQLLLHEPDEEASALGWTLYKESLPHKKTPHSELPCLLSASCIAGFGSSVGSTPAFGQPQSSATSVFGSIATPQPFGQPASGTGFNFGQSTPNTGFSFNQASSTPALFGQPSPAPSIFGQASSSGFSFSQVPCCSVPAIASAWAPVLM